MFTEENSEAAPEQDGLEGPDQLESEVSEVSEVWFVLFLLTNQCRIQRYHNRVEEYVFLSFFSKHP